jgi:hypothetical protein
MKKSKSLWAIVATVVCVVIAVIFSASIQGGQNTYELHPNLSIPEYKTDTARVIEAYERLMDRYMDLTGSHLSTVGIDLRNVVTQLDSIDGRLTEMESRLARIEQALGVEKASELVGKDLRSKTNHPASTRRSIQ